MDTFLPEGFEPGQTRASMGHPARSRKLCVQAGGVFYPVLRRWATGFAAAEGEVPVLNGVIEMYDGARHLHQCLITGHETSNGEQIFKTKRASTVEYSIGRHIGAGGESGVSL